MAKKKKKVEKDIDINLDEEKEVVEEEIESYDEDEEEERIVQKKKKAKKKIINDEDDENDNEDDDDEEFQEEDLTDEFEDIPMEERLINVEKKVNTIVILLVLTLIFSFITLIMIATNFGSEAATTTTTSTDDTATGYDTSKFKEITGEDIKDESDGEAIVILIGYQGCGYCSQYAPILEEVAEDYGITIRYIDISKITKGDDSYNAIVNLTGSGEWETFASDYFGKTPQTLIVKNNTVVGGISGLTDSTSISSAFEDAGITKS